MAVAANQSEQENIGLNEAIDALESLSNYRDWMMDEFGADLHGHTVEIGAGAGNISEKLLKLVPSVDAVEPSRELGQRLVARLSDNPNLNIHHAMAEDWLVEAETASCDSIVMINVLEHIEDDSGALRQMYRTLRPDGALLLFVPALSFLFSRLDHEHGHYRRYSKRQLREAVDAAGFSIQRAKYIDMAGILPWLIFNKWMGKTEFDPKMVGLYDRFGIPVTRCIEKLTGSPIGKNVLLVARKEA